MTKICISTNLGSYACLHIGNLTREDTFLRRNFVRWREVQLYHYMIFYLHTWLHNISYLSTCIIIYCVIVLLYLEKNYMHILNFYTLSCRWSCGYWNTEIERSEERSVPKIKLWCIYLHHSQRLGRPRIYQSVARQHWWRMVSKVCKTCINLYAWCSWNIHLFQNMHISK